MVQPVTLDFETEGIELRPAYPPKPVGLAVRWPGRNPKYMAWGHPCENNCTKTEALRELRRAWKHPGGVLWHNAAFDLAVAAKFFGMRWPAWDRFHDTKLLAFLDNPYRLNISLKALGEDLLGMPHTEQDELQEWIIENVPECRRKKSIWGGYICRAPAKLAGRYAIGDVVRTYGLFKHYAWIRTAMPEAYQRERELLGVLDEMSAEGFPVTPKIGQLVKQSEKDLTRIDAWVRRYLGLPKGFDLQKREQLADAIEDAGLLEEWIETSTGKRSLAHEDFTLVCQDKVFARGMHQRSMMKTVHQTFLVRWQAMAQVTGRVHVTWNSTTGMHGDGTGVKVGARTGRLSSTPNAQNISKEGPGKSVLRNLELINLRKVVRAEPNSKLGVADYAQQEPRQAAHFAGGNIARMYREDPTLDFHNNTVSMTAQMG